MSLDARTFNGWPLALHFEGCAACGQAEGLKGMCLTSYALLSFFEQNRGAIL